MKWKVLLVIVDGLRSEAIETCGHNGIKELMRTGSSTLKLKGCNPGTTIPAIASMYYGMPPERHKIISKNWSSQYYNSDYPVDSPFDIASSLGGRCCIFTDSDDIRDIHRPRAVHRVYYMKPRYNKHLWCMRNEEKLTEKALKYAIEFSPDLACIYFSYPDIARRTYGENSKEYLQAVANASICIERMHSDEGFGERYVVIITSTQGSEECGSANIPLILHGHRCPKGKTIEEAGVLDIAPTISNLLGIGSDPSWEGRSLIEGDYIVNPKVGMV